MLPRRPGRIVDQMLRRKLTPQIKRTAQLCPSATPANSRLKHMYTCPYRQEEGVTSNRVDPREVTR